MRIRFRVRTASWLLACLTASFVGCDEAPPVPPADLTSRTQETPDEPARPTTQELLSGPRKVIPLGTLPMTVRVPESWKIENLDSGSITLLEGHAPSGLVQIGLAQRPFVQRDKLESILSRATKEKTDRPDIIKLLDIKPLPGDAGGQILERQSLGKTLPPVALDAEGKTLSKPETLYSWTITYFIPQADGFEAYELNFVGLTAEQFQVDQAMLREIIDSVTYNGVASTAPAGV